jgi:hypothetical protein
MKKRTHERLNREGLSFEIGWRSATIAPRKRTKGPQKSTSTIKRFCFTSQPDEVILKNIGAGVY